MANALYDKGRNKFARGEIAWRAGGDTFGAVLVDASDYSRDLANDEYLSDVPAGARVATIAVTPLDPTNGVCDAGDVTFLTVTGDECEYIIIYKDTGDPSTSPLIACIDSATGLPVTPGGGNIQVVWDNGANKIFKL